MRTCENGHEYEKRSDCPTCPICEAERQPPDGFLSDVSAPARRALENEEIETVSQLAEYSEAEILALHGIGPSSLPVLERALADHDLAFRDE